jgi:hypothetical protein
MTNASIGVVNMDSEAHMSTPQTHRAGELWALMHGKDAVSCIAVEHPLGVELRYIVNEHPLMARVLDDWSDVAGVSDIWRKRLEADGWVPPVPARIHPRRRRTVPVRH